MDEETLEHYVIQQIKAQSSEEVVFAWQGGEPTLLGLDFFQKAVTLQQKHGLNKKIINTLQTNGILFDGKWCHLLKKHNFIIGI